jgi:hypothetical protein
VLTRSQRIRVVHRRFDPYDNEGSFAMTTPDSKAIEERLSTCGFLPQTDADILALLGMVREAQEYAKSLQPGYWHQKAVEECGEWKAKAEAAEAKLAEVSGQLATVQSVRVAEEERMVELTNRAEYAEARLVEALQRERTMEEALAEVTRHHEQSIELRIALGERLRAVELERNTAHSLILGVQLTCEFGDAKEMYATMQKFSNESQRVVGDAQSYADSYRVVAAMAETAEVYRAELAANTDTFRQIIASASYRLVWAVDGRGNPEQALRAVEALGEAYEASQLAAFAIRDEVKNLQSMQAIDKEAKVSGV